MTDEREVIVIMGSEKDLDFTRPALDLLEDFEVRYDLEVASAHKTPERVLDILEDNEGSGKKVYLTVAGRSNALSGFVDANTNFPVIACPPYSSKYGGADIFSSLRMPSGVGPMVVLDPENAALAALKILSLDDSGLRERLAEYRTKIKDDLREVDVEYSG